MRAEVRINFTNFSLEAFPLKFGRGGTYEVGKKSLEVEETFGFKSGTF